MEPQTQQVTLTITAKPDGSVTVSGPIDQRLFCFGMLEIAKEIIHQKAEENRKIIQPVTHASIVQFINPNGG